MQNSSVLDPGIRPLCAFYVTQPGKVSGLVQNEAFALFFWGSFSILAAIENALNGG